MSARGRHRRQRTRRISRLSLMLTAGGAGVALPLIAAGGASAATPDAVSASVPKHAPQQVPQQAPQRAVQGAPQAAPATGPATYTVLSGDTLFKIAKAEGVDGGWRQIYERNRDVIGADPNLIHPGQELRVRGGGSAPAPEQSQAPEPEAPEAEAPPAETPEPPAEDTATQTGSGYTSPVAGAIGTGYGVAGSNWSSGYHTGVDFPVGEGTSVVSIASGEVVSAGDGGAYGNEVVILHADGHYSQYAHLSSISVSVGQQVSTGEQIGLSGTTGNSTGPHLHFEVRTGPEYGSDIDPLAYLQANGVAI